MCGSEGWLGCRSGSKIKPHCWHLGGSVQAPSKAGDGVRNRVVSLITSAACEVTQGRRAGPLSVTCCGCFIGYSLHSYT